MDRSPELEGFSSFWISLLGSVVLNGGVRIKKVDLFIIGLYIFNDILPQYSLRHQNQSSQTLLG